MRSSSSSFEARELTLRIAAVVEERELQPVLVREVDGLEELHGFGGVDQHRNVVPGARLPDGIQLRVVHLEPRAVGLADAQPEALADLEPDGPIPDVLVELGRSPLAEPGSDVFEGDVGEEAEAVSVRACRDGFDVLSEGLAASSAEVDDGSQVQLVHLRGQARHPLRRHRLAMVAVDVHGGVPGAPNLVLLRDERRLRLVVEDARGGEVGRSKLPRPNHGGSRLPLLEERPLTELAPLTLPLLPGLSPLRRFLGLLSPFLLPLGRGFLSCARSSRESDGREE